MMAITPRVNGIDKEIASKQDEIAVLEHERQRLIDSQISDEFAAISYEFCHVGWNKRTQVWYVRTNIASPVGMQKHVGKYDNKELACYVGEKLDEVLRIIDRL